MTSLQTFTFTFTFAFNFAFAFTTQIRTVLEDGQVKFVARDICNDLRLGNPAETVKGLAEHERGISIPPVFWTAQGRTIASSVLKRCN